jgi:hypothetical protein
VDDTYQKSRREGNFILNLAVQKNWPDTSSSVDVDDVSFELQDFIDSVGMGEFSGTHHLRMRTPVNFQQEEAFRGLEGRSVGTLPVMYNFCDHAICVGLQRGNYICNFLCRVRHEI